MAALAACWHVVRPRLPCLVAAFFAFFGWVLVACQDANPKCPCLATILPLVGNYIEGACLYARPRYTSEEFCLSKDFGTGHCFEHDKHLHPICADEQGVPKSTAPGWCSVPWCFVDPNQCDDRYVDDVLPSLNFPEANVFFSYETCGEEQTFAKWSQAMGKTAPELVSSVEGYAKEMRSNIEGFISTVGASTTEAATCQSIPSGCSCSSCTLNSEWTDKTYPEKDQYLDFQQASFVVTQARYNNASDAAINRDKCMSMLVGKEMRRLARSEYNDDSRIAYIYYGSQSTGSMFQWPAQRYCPKDYDARFRPWYAAAASGPKDVAIVLDKSGSMGTGSQFNRWEAVQLAAKKVLLTLGNADYATVITFSTEAEVYEGTPDLHRMTFRTRRKMEAFIDSERTIGGTNFKAAFYMAGHAFHAGRSSGKTSGCLRAILFLTDGEDSDFQAKDIKSIPGLEDVTIFTFSFGTGIGDQSVMRQLACQNKGFWNRVPDGGDIETAMASYYQLFAGGLDGSSARWIEYEDAATGTDIVASCYPAYDRQRQAKQLYGVVCVDMSLIIDLPTLKSKSGYTEAQSELQKRMNECPAISLPEAELDRLRIALVGEEEGMCRPCDMGTGSCSNAGSANTGTRRVVLPLRSILIRLLALLCVSVLLGL